MALVSDDGKGHVGDIEQDEDYAEEKVYSHSFAKRRRKTNKQGDGG